MTFVLPAIDHPDRQAAIRAAHLRLRRWQGRPSFADTALRLGLSEAEILWAHRGGFVQARSLEDPLFQAALRLPGEWLVQGGDRLGFVQFPARLDECATDDSGRHWAGPGWNLRIRRPEQCTAFLLRCCCRSAAVHLLLCDSQGRPALRLLPRAAPTQQALAHGFAVSVEIERRWLTRCPDVAPPSWWKGGAAPVVAYLARAEAARRRIRLRRAGDIAVEVLGGCRAAPPNDRVGGWRIGPAAVGLDLDSLRMDPPSAQEETCRFRQRDAHWRLGGMATTGS